jgi:hypothetical protein
MSLMSEVKLQPLSSASALQKGGGILFGNGQKP